MEEEIRLNFNALKNNPIAENTHEFAPDQAFEIESFLKLAVAQGFSDVHIRINTPPMVRKDGIMVKTKLPPLTEADIDKMVEKLVPPAIRANLDNLFDVDFSLEIQGISRFRVNFLRELGSIGFVLRLIPFNVPPFDSLLLPPVIKQFTTLLNGLVLVTGPTGCGKSTTLASLLDYINTTYHKHIITLENPIEFLYTDKNCIFTQRELGLDTDSFPNGLKYALRQDPDVILIGEMRDRETITSALKAAETGHLVFSTLHTTDAVQTIYRMINFFEPHEREPVRVQIASTLKGTITQKLVKKAGGKGRVPATEILVVTPAVKDYINKNEIENIYELIKSGDYAGMMTMNQSLFKLVNAHMISDKAALEASDTPNEMKHLLHGAFHGTGISSKD